MISGFLATPAGVKRWLPLAGASLVAVAFTLLSSNAFAEERAKTTEGKDGYGYEFSDDPLAAGGFGPSDATIRVRPGPVRTTLIRPRTSFVPEMLKSVENL
jgi:hypothetical protein